MATGMVLIIVSRNIDLSVGSLLGFLGYTMAMVQTDWIPETLGLGFERSRTPGSSPSRVGIALGALDRRRSRASSSPTAACPRSSSRSAASSSGAASSSATRQQGQTLAPARHDFQLLGGGPERARSASGGAGCSASSPASASSLTLVARPAPAPALRLPGPADVGRGRARRRRLRGCPRRRLDREQLLVADALATQYADHGITSRPAVHPAGIPVRRS